MVVALVRLHGSVMVMVMSMMMMVTMMMLMRMKMKMGLTSRVADYVGVHVSAAEHTVLN